MLNIWALIAATLFLLSLTECRTVHIYSSSSPNDILAKFHSPNYVDYKFATSTSRELQSILYLNSRTGVLRLDGKPSCRIFTENPIKLVIIARPATATKYRVLASIWLQYHGEKCFVKFRRKPEYNTILSKIADVGKKVYQLQDLFNGELLPIRPSDLFIANKKGKELFKVDETTGHLLLSQSLEHRPERLLFVIVCSNHTHRSARLRITVDHSMLGYRRVRLRRRVKKNNPPRFTGVVSEASVSEDAKKGTVVTTVSANDPDSGSNGMIRYSMSPTQNLISAGFFSINLITGVIVTTQPLDRERFSRHYFRVKAEDQATPPLEGYMDLTIVVLDVNDNSPIFERNIYGTKIPEDKGIGDFVLAVRANDQDSGANGKVKYCILNKNKENSAFEINENTGAITVMKTLDREKVMSYNLQVQAQDQGHPPRTATVKVIITITDVNDCTPQFSKKVYTATIREDVRINTLVTTVSASDCDAGSNGEVFYEVVSGNDDNLFSINRINGQIRVKGKLDFEQSPMFNLLVTAQDKGQAFLYNQTTVDITLIDVNDNAPHFYNPHFQHTVAENVQVNQVIYVVKAYDGDDGTNGEITYSIMGADVPFAIGSQNGFISVTKPLDRETTHEFTFRIKARDKGVPYKEGTTLITIKVLDINDNPPKFTKSEYRTSISENLRRGTTVLTVTAKDPDSGPTIVVYSIESSSSRRRCFRINPKGIITLSCTLNYNRKQQYFLTISASDGILNSTAPVYINVTDANTHAPEFKRRTYRAYVSEIVSPGTSVLEVSATDQDTGSNAKISYSFEKPVPAFAVDASTGVIETVGTLDREKKDTYRFEVTATDHGVPRLKSKSVVYIHVTDANDNAPQFLKPKYTAKIPEDVRPGERVIEVSARDDDKGKNQEVIYSFSAKGDGGGAFQIDVTQGVIRTVLPLDREKVPRYQLTVIATDRGVPPKQSSVIVDVILTDVKDSPPVFEKPVYDVSFPEDTKPQTPILHVRARSQDLTPDTGMLYSIVSGNSPQLFTINPKTGEIRTAMPLDYETQAQYRLRVRATLSPFFAEAVVNIMLEDINDNEPVLMNFYMNINVREGVVPPEAKYKIPAYDPDVSDKLTFFVEKGNVREWVVLNSVTGELTVKRKLLQVNEPPRIKIRVWDGKFNATADGFITVTSITTELLQHSIQLEIDDIDVTDFLNLAYERLIQSIAAIMKCKKDQILLFDIKQENVPREDDDDMPRLKIWMVLRKMERQSFAGYFDASYVRYVVYLHRSQICKAVGIKTLSFPDDDCSKKPCNFLKPKSFYDCLTFQNFGGESKVYSSPKVVFRTVPVVKKFNCTCPVDYRGEVCDSPLNLCYSNPCGNNGECVSTEKGYACLCKPDRLGDHCQINMTHSVCPRKPAELLKTAQLLSNPCKNGGACVNKDQGGFRCECKDKSLEDSSTCGLSAISFRDGDYAAFPALRQQWRLHISLEFATLQSDAVLLYNGQLNDERDFIAVEVSRGQAQFTVSTGGKAVRARTGIEGGLNDGTWHRVTAMYINKTAIVVVDECKLAVAVQFGTTQGSYECAAATKLSDKDSARSLRLTGPMLLGGLYSTTKTFPITNKHFTGCLRHVTMDYKELDLAAPNWKRGTTPKCSIKSDFCRNAPCKRGNCTNTWGTYKCHCPEGLGGKRCEIAMKHKMRFAGQSILVKTFRTTSVTLPWQQSLMFRTRRSLGILLETRFRSNSGVLKIVDGRVTYLFDKHLTVNLSQLKVDDGAWHHVEVTWLSGQVRLTGDYIYYATTTHSNIQLEFTSELILGGRQVVNMTKPKPQAHIEDGFVGCIMGLTVDGSQIDTTQATQQNVFNGCDMPSHCQSSPCLGDGTCTEGWDTYKCLCPTGYIGKRCTNVCDLHPCQHGLCELSSSSERGFKCVCPEKYSGEYCETRKKTPCQDKFFGASKIGLCGPCKCPVGRNFDPVCNKTTGECYCNPLHYRSPSGDSCLKCNCEEIGSLSMQCRVSDGQCPCQEGSSTGAPVIGRRCDTCHDRQSEVMKGKGCVVINTSCPRSIAEDIWWKRGAFGKLAEQKCPFGASGIATRYCDKNKGWQEPNLLKCVSNSFLIVRNRLKRLETGKMLWSPDIAMDLARQLDLAITLATRLYPLDIEIALKAITVLFDYESRQNETSLVSAKNHEFAQILVQSASMLFNINNKEVWSVVQRNSAGTAELMEKMENFSGTLANNLVHLKRARYRRNAGSIIPPYTILTSNILMELHPLTVRNFNGMIFPPRADSFQPYSSDWGKISSRVKLPADLFQTPGHKVLERNAAVGYMIIRNIGDLLPKSFDAQISNSKYNVEVNSDIVSVKLPGMENTPLIAPIHVTFVHKQVNRSEYLCVFWNYSVPDTRGGGWSTSGCRRIAINWTHTTCACNHMTSFAVLSDLNLEFPPKVAFALRIGTYIGIAVSVAILLVAFVSFVCLRGLKKSNANDIHKNLVAAIVIAEIIFLAGINRTSDLTACRLIAILLHYFFSTVFTWMLVEGVHMYRRLTEKRNVDAGRMRFYYFLGWGCPAIVVGISAGLSTDGYGNDRFCWMATDGTLIWTFTIPVMIVVAVNTVVFMMALCASLQKTKRKRRRRQSYSPHGPDDRSSLNAGMRASAVVLPLLGVSLVVGILMVNKEMEMFHYLFAALTACQGLFIFLFYCLFDEKVRKEYKNAYVRWKTGDKTYGIPKPVKHFKRSYHPSEIQALRSPYHFDDDDNANTSTSTTEPTSSLRSSTLATSRPTSEAYSTAMSTAATGSIPDSTATSAMDGTSDPETEELIKKPPKAKYYPDNPELELARKMWETPDKSEHSTTQPETSSDEEEERPPSPVILSDSSASSDDEQTPNGDKKTPIKPKKRPKGATFYASDGPMHSTPMDTTPEEELEKKFNDSDSSETDEEDKVVPVKPRKDGPTFKVIPEIISENKPSSTVEPTTPAETPTEVQLQKKPLKSALKKPKPGTYIPIVLPDLPSDEGKPEDKSPDKSVEGSERRHRRGEKSGEKKKKKRGRHKHGSTSSRGENSRRFVKFRGDRSSLQMSEPSEFI